MTVHTLSWLGAVTGVVGALLIAWNSRSSKFGWIIYLLSNSFWIVYAIATHTHSLLFMQLFLTATTVVGLYRWFRPRGVHSEGLQTWRDASVLTRRPLSMATYVPRAEENG